LGKLQAHQAMFCYRVGPIPQARQLLHASIALLQPLHQPRELAFALYTLGYLTSSSAETSGELAEGKSLLETSVAIYRECDDKWRITRVLNALGYVHGRMGDYERVQQLHAEGLAIAREIGDRRTEAHHLDYLGQAMSWLGNLDTAEELHRASLAIFKELDIQWGIAEAGLYLADDLRLLKRYREARSQGLETLALFKRLGIPYGIISTLSILGKSALALGEARAAHQYFGQALRATIDYEAAFVWGMMLDLALYYATDGRLAEAVEMGTGVLHQSDASPAAQKEAARLCDELAAQLPAEIAANARARGSVKSPEQAIQEVWREIRG
jgi:tetratricopeptide (TPR) repeat protein